MFPWLLVIAQFTLSAALVLSTRWSPVPWLAMIIALPGIALAVWAWAKVGLLKLRIHPSTTDRTQLITDGPFSIVRHPMYVGLLWFTAALLASEFAWWRVIAWIALATVLNFKSRMEEQDMKVRFVEYDAYVQRVGRFWPFTRRLLVVRS
jgi:protein-S-isoprenylcysteine O-methyltransferase Ste14